MPSDQWRFLLLVRIWLICLLHHSSFWEVRNPYRKDMASVNEVKAAMSSRHCRGPQQWAGDTQLSTHASFSSRFLCSSLLGPEGAGQRVLLDPLLGQRWDRRSLVSHFSKKTPGHNPRKVANKWCISPGHAGTHFPERLHPECCSRFQSCVACLYLQWLETKARPNSIKRINTACFR